MRNRTTEQKKDNDKVSTDAIAQINARFRTILFSGFHVKPDEHWGGWVYWLPRYLQRHTTLKIFLLSNDHTIYQLNQDETVDLTGRRTLPPIDLFFGRTLSSFDPNDPLIKSAAFKLIYSMGKKLPKAMRAKNVHLIDDAEFIKPIPEYERQFFFPPAANQPQENIILFPASLHPRKGQLKFAKQLSPKTFAGKKLILCGTMQSPKYANQCFKTLKQKQIDFDYLPKVTKKELGELYRRSRLTVIYSTRDWNPRTYYESLLCGTPCLISNHVRIAAEVQSFALRTSRFTLNRSLIQAYEKPESSPQKLSEKVAALTEESSVYNKLFAQIFETKDTTCSINSKFPPGAFHSEQTGTSSAASESDKISETDTKGVS